MVFNRNIAKLFLYFICSFIGSCHKISNISFHVQKALVNHIKPPSGWGSEKVLLWKNRTILRSSLHIHFCFWRKYEKYDVSWQFYWCIDVTSLENHFCFIGDFWLSQFLFLLPLLFFFQYCFYHHSGSNIEDLLIYVMFRLDFDFLFSTVFWKWYLLSSLKFHLLSLIHFFLLYCHLLKTSVCFQIKQDFEFVRNSFTSIFKKKINPIKNTSQLIQWHILILIKLWGGIYIFTMIQVKTRLDGAMYYCW